MINVALVVSAHSKVCFQWKCPFLNENEIALSKMKFQTLNIATMSGLSLPHSHPLLTLSSFSFSSSVERSAWDGVSSTCVPMIGLLSCQTEQRGHSSLPHPKDHLESDH